MITGSTDQRLTLPPSRPLSRLPTRLSPVLLLSLSRLVLEPVFDLVLFRFESVSTDWSLLDRLSLDCLSVESDWLSLANEPTGLSVKPPMPKPPLLDEDVSLFCEDELEWFVSVPAGSNVVGPLENPNAFEDESFVESVCDSLCPVKLLLLSAEAPAAPAKMSPPAIAAVPSERIITLDICDLSLFCLVAGPRDLVQTRGDRPAAASYLWRYRVASGRQSDGTRSIMVSVLTATVTLPSCRGFGPIPDSDWFKTQDFTENRL